MRVTTAEFIKRYGALADRALSEPVTITKNGRDRLVLLSADPAIDVKHFVEVRYTIRNGRFIFPD